MNILLLGSGGREHAMALKIAQSSITEKLFVAPGNAGTAEVAINVALSEVDFPAIKEFVLAEGINMVVVGPEQPLVKGIKNFFNDNEDLSHVAVIGPDSEGARLEGSKDYSKQFMKKYNIPTARYGTFEKATVKEAFAFLDTLSAPYVLKADGLAAGKGVLILNNKEEAKKELNDMFAGKFGDASTKVVIEEFLDGIELSVFVLTDGEAYKILPEAKDYKRIGEGDTGLNTGGMGAVSPVHFADALFMEKIENQIVSPTIKGLIAEGIDYEGFIFVGIMNVNGEPYVIEYNCRMGDPETEVVLPRIKSDLVALFEHIANGTLSEADIEISEHFATTVIAVSGGYPEDYKKGFAVEGLSDTKGKRNIMYHAGTKLDENGAIVTNGGRVLASTGVGVTLKDALQESYAALSKINFDAVYYRKDIGKDLMAK